MSSGLAIAAITFALTGLLREALSAQDISAAVGGTVTVSALPPDLIKTDATSARQLNLFLYQVRPNEAWLNAGLPARSARGERLANPPLALDLHYLLTAYAGSDYQAEMILGHAMLTLHESPILARESLRGWENSQDPLQRTLSRSQIGDQVERIKVSPERMDIEEISKLWAAFQAKYRPTVAYLVSVALLQSSLAVRSPLPVLTRGNREPGLFGEREHGVSTQPDLTPALPALSAVTPPNAQPGVRLGEELTLSGFNLLEEPGDTLEVTARHPRMAAPETLPVTTKSATEIVVALPAGDPAKFPAGIYAVSVGYLKQGVRGRSTNELPFLLAPNQPVSPATFGQAVAPDPQDGSRVRATLQVICVPHVWQGQRASLLLNEREALAQPFAGATGATLTFVFDGLLPGDYLVRLRVEGAESLFIDRTSKPPVFDETQRIAIGKP